MDEYTENTANTRTEENMTAGYGAQEEKNDGVMQEEPAAAYTDYYADGTPVMRREEPKEPPRAQDPERPNYEPYRFEEPERQERHGLPFLL